MASIIFDTGALIALERGDRAVAALLSVAGEQQTPVVTSSACVAEAWRDSCRQVRLVRFLRGVDERALNPESARRAGELMGKSGTDQITDAAVALLAADGDRLITSDPGDLSYLLEILGIAAQIRRV